MRLFPSHRNALAHQLGRRGSAAVEFAVIAPILATLMLCMVEVTRAIQVKELLTDSARSGCRIGSLPGMSNDNITSNVTSILSNNGIQSADVTVTVKVNDNINTNAKNAVRSDKISVTVSVPISKVNWVSPFIFPSASVTSEAMHMVRQ